jgi:hypothetical protein
MSAPFPRRTRYLRAFLVSLLLVLACLFGLLFGVRLEAVVMADGVFKARDQQELRALAEGPVELGWYEGEIARGGAAPMRVRLDAAGDGLTDPAQGKVLAVQARALADGARAGELRFHALRAGDLLWPGQHVARVQADELRQELLRVQERLQERQSRDEPDHLLRAERDLLRGRLARSVLRAPAGGYPWVVLKVHVEPLAPVRPGDAVALVAPWDPAAGRPRDLVAEMDIDEKLCDELTPGQAVRLYSTMYNHRLYGLAEARLERLEPWGEMSAGGRRQFRAVAAVTEVPFPVKLGSSFKAEIVTGRKAVYRLILEH